MKKYVCLFLILFCCNNFAQMVDHYTGEIKLKELTPVDENVDQISKIVVYNLNKNINNKTLNYKKAGFYSLRDVIESKFKIEKKLNKKFDETSYTATSNGRSQSQENVKTKDSIESKFEFKNRLYQGKMYANYNYGIVYLKNNINVLKGKDAYDGRVGLNYSNELLELEPFYQVKKECCDLRVRFRTFKSEQIEIQPSIGYYSNKMIKTEVKTAITPEIKFIYTNEMGLASDVKINSYNFSFNTDF